MSSSEPTGRTKCIETRISGYGVIGHCLYRRECHGDQRVVVERSAVARGGVVTRGRCTPGRRVSLCDNNNKARKAAGPPRAAGRLDGARWENAHTHAHNRKKMKRKRTQHRVTPTCLTILIRFAFLSSLAWRGSYHVTARRGTRCSMTASSQDSKPSRGCSQACSQAIV